MKIRNEIVKTCNPASPPESHSHQRLLCFAVVDPYLCPLTSVL